MEQAEQSDCFETRPGCPAGIEDSKSHTKKPTIAHQLRASSFEFPEKDFFPFLSICLFFSHNY